MRIAFYLDNTLIRGGHDFALKTPKRRFWARLLGKEALRVGTEKLVAHCQRWG